MQLGETRRPPQRHLIKQGPRSRGHPGVAQAMLTLVHLYRLLPLQAWSLPVPVYAQCQAQRESGDQRRSRQRVNIRIRHALPVGP